MNGSGNGSGDVGSWKAAVNLTIAVVAGWLVCFWPARMHGGGDGIFWMSVAAFCCLIPGWIVVLLSRLAIFPDDLWLMLAQTAVRLVSVVGAALVVRSFWPKLGVADFFGWLIGFYLLTLLLEVYLLRGGRSQGRSGVDAGA